MIKTFHKILIFTFILAFIFGCKHDAKTGNEIQPLDTNVVFPQIDELLIQHAADSVIADIMTKYYSMIFSADKYGGPIYAFRKVHGKFPDILQDFHDSGWTIDFATETPRNKTFTADPDEIAIIKYFEDSYTVRQDKGEWIGSDDSLKYRYFKSLRMEKSCLTCHGIPSDMPPMMAEELDKLYPDDKAAGFKPGDLYGIFVVEIEWPKGKEHALKLAERRR